MEDKVFTIPRFVEIKHGYRNIYAEVLESGNDFIRIDINKLPSEVPDKYYFKEEVKTPTITSTKESITRVYSNGDYIIYISNL